MLNFLRHYYPVMFIWILLISTSACVDLSDDPKDLPAEPNLSNQVDKPLINCSRQPPANYSFIAGQSYFGANQYIEYIPGTLPIIISSPHEGQLTPKEIPIYREGLASDGGSQKSARLVAQTLFNLTGKLPHLIINHVAMNRLNLNFSQIDENQNPQALQAWQEFHDFINHAKNWVSLTCEKGLYFDFHTNGHDHGYNELGYLLTRNELNLSESEIDKLILRSSMRNLASQDGYTLSEILHGEFSLGEFMMEDHQLLTIPNMVDIPFQHSYFNGGYNTRAHGSIEGGVVDGIQIESHFNYVNSGETARLNYSQKLAQAIFKYVEFWYGFDLENL